MQRETLVTLLLNCMLLKTPPNDIVSFLKNVTVNLEYNTEQAHLFLQTQRVLPIPLLSLSTQNETHKKRDKNSLLFSFFCTLFTDLSLSLSLSLYYLVSLSFSLSTCSPPLL
jgi:hypothetical protein